LYLCVATLGGIDLYARWVRQPRAASPVGHRDTDTNCPGNDPQPHWGTQAHCFPVDAGLNCIARVDDQLAG
jgi:hypothetical protein